MVYRTGGSILGEAGVLTLRAGGDIDLRGSITDGFFQYADPLDPTYLAVKGTFTSNLTAVINGGRTSLTANLTAFSGSATGLPTAYAGIAFYKGNSSAGTVRVTEVKSTTPAIAQAPYSAASNSPAANTGNSLAYSVQFPSITKLDGSTTPVSSWSQTLVAGAAPRSESADPARLAAGSAGRIILSEQPAYNYVDSIATIVANGLVDDGAFSVSGSPVGATGDPAQWIAALRAAAGARLDDNSSALVTFGVPSDAAYAYVLNLWNDYATAKGLADKVDFRWHTSAVSGFGDRLSVVTKFKTFADFYDTKIRPNLNEIALLYSTVKAGATGGTVYPTTVVRTGTGDINVVAGGDLQMKGGASIYTAGRRDPTVFNDFTTAPANATYGVGGGHLQIAVGGDIDVALPADRSKMQHYTEGLNRQGKVDLSYVFSSEQSSWWVNYANFERGVGALGGGNITISAGGDLDNLTVALPTNGRVRGGRTTTERKLLELRNGGAMTIEAGGAIRAGYYYIGRGAGTIDAGEFAVGRTVTISGINGSSTTYPIAPILSLGDATLDVRTAGDLMLQTVLDPLIVSKGLNSSVESAFMSGQTERTSLSLTSTGGDVVLVGQTTYLSKDLPFIPNTTQPYATVNRLAGNIYPSKTSITALNGSVFNDVLYTMPSSAPELRILAGDDISPGTIVQSRAVPSMVPSPFEPVVNASGSPVGVSDIYGILANAISPFSVGHSLVLYKRGNPQLLPHANDYEPSRMYALEGTIRAGAITTSEQTWFRAGTDIRDINYNLRNLHPTDVSLLEAGNDIIGGVLVPFYQKKLGTYRYGGKVDIQGPGALVLTAGRDVYGADLRLYSAGSRSYDDETNRPLDNSKILGLPDQGAAITVMAGLRGKQPSYEAFMAAYLDPANVASMPEYLKTTLPGGAVVPLYLTDAFETRKSGSVKMIRNGLASFVEDMTGEKLSPLDAWTRFKTLPQFTQERFLRQVYLQELREAGSDQNTPGEHGLPRNGGYNRGYAAIDSLFPGKDWKGDVTIGNALFRTMAGGDIEVLTPGGGLQVAALSTDPGPGYGMVTLGYGHINIFARNNVVVNRSRILTFAGGDETIWSTVGDIDAGRGAKTTRVASEPEIQTNVNAVTRVLERADISGSGIGTIIGFAGVEEGDVNLIAPQGTVNAGDAGVRVSGNLNLAALFVLNANNFQVSGEIKGLPQKETPLTALKLDTGDSSQKAAADAAKDATQSSKSQQASIIIVEVLGYGGGDGDAPAKTDETQPPRRNGVNEQRTQNPDSAYQVLGAGPMTAEEARQVIAERRRASGRE
jgi:filamentous hemagglutinin-like outer membrane protein